MQNYLYYFEIKTKRANVLTLKRYPIKDLYLFCEQQKISTRYRGVFIVNRDISS